jgi:glyoxylase-like metal-dependent hydrolase (beta-lactamase superfamily II)
MWRALEIELKRHLNGYLFLTKDGMVLVDPPAAAEIIIRDIEALGKPRYVLLTGARQERRARQYQHWYGAEVYAPVGDRRMLALQAEHYYEDETKLPGGFRAIRLKHQRTPGESALLHEPSDTLVTGHLVGEPEGYVRMFSPGVYWNFSRALEAQLTLLEYDYEQLLPGRGKPIREKARMVLAQYIAAAGSDL